MSNIKNPADISPGQGVFLGISLGITVNRSFWPNCLMVWGTATLKVMPGVPSTLEVRETSAIRFAIAWGTAIQLSRIGLSPFSEPTKKQIQIANSAKRKFYRVAANLGEEIFQLEGEAVFLGKGFPPFKPDDLIGLTGRNAMAILGCAQVESLLGERYKDARSLVQMLAFDLKISTRSFEISIV